MLKKYLIGALVAAPLIKAGYFPEKKVVYACVKDLDTHAPIYEVYVSLNGQFKGYTNSIDGCLQFTVDESVTYQKTLIRNFYDSASENYNWDGNMFPMWFMKRTPYSNPQ